MYKSHSYALEAHSTQTHRHAHIFDVHHVYSEVVTGPTGHTVPVVQVPHQRFEGDCRTNTVAAQYYQW